MPLVAWMLHAAALWAWHAPAFFEAALARPGIHTLQHASFLVSALLFWWTVFGNTARGERSAHALLSLFTTMVHTGALGALLTLAPGIWYPSYIESTSALGFDPLQDQQLGGLVMWVPGGLAYLIGGLVVGARWLTRRTPPPAVPPISGAGTGQACAAPPRRMADMRLARFQFCSRRVPGPWCLLSAWMILSASLAFHAPVAHRSAG